MLWDFNAFNFQNIKKKKFGPNPLKKYYLGLTKL